MPMQNVLTEPAPDNDEFFYTSLQDELAGVLIQQLTYEYEHRYGESAADEMTDYPPELFLPPHGAFVLLLRNGHPIAGGAFMRHDTTTAEFKRIWTHSEFRRQGLARLVLTELEQQAYRQGYSSVYLTTGARQPEATGLYLSSGYEPLFDVSIVPGLHDDLAFRKYLRPDR